MEHRIIAAQESYCRGLLEVFGDDAVCIGSMAPNMAEQRWWYEFFKAGFTEQNLETVVRFLLREIKKEKRNLGALKLSNLLDPIRFKEDLIVAKLAHKLKADAFKPQGPVKRAVVQADPERERAALERFRAENSEALRKYKRQHNENRN